MVSSDFRKEAREKLSGKWGKAACITLAYAFISFVLNFIQGLFPDSMQALLSLVITVIEVPLALGLIISFVRLFNDDEVKAFDFLSSGFSNFVKSWGITFQIFLKMIAPIILMVVAFLILAFGAAKSITTLVSSSSSTGSIWMLLGGILLFVSSIWSITKSYYYQLAYIVAAENPELSAKETVEESQKIMTGNRGKLFCLQLSFIGWAILAAFTLGIGYLWLAPYIQLAIIAFYKFVCGKNEINNYDVIDENSTNE